MGNYFGEKKKGKDICSVCVNKYFLFVLTVGSQDLIYRTSLSALLYNGINFFKCITVLFFVTFLSIPSKIHLLVLVKSFQQHVFSRIIYLHSFTELFHKIFPCSSEQIAIIHESYLWFIVASVEKYLSEVFVYTCRKVNFLNWYFTNVSLFSTLISVWLKHLMCGQLKKDEITQAKLVLLSLLFLCKFMNGTKKNKKWKSCRKSCCFYVSSFFISSAQVVLYSKPK